MGKLFSMSGNYVKSMVYGGLDGIITTFAVVSGVTGGALDFEVIIILGFSNLLADGLSMAVGDYLSSKSENEYEDLMIEEKEEEIRSQLNQERAVLAESYQSRGMSDEDALSVAKTLAKYEDIFVEERINQEYGDQGEEGRPINNALVTFFSFVVFGLVPLLSYLLVFISPTLLNHAFLLASILTGLTLFILGVVKSRITHAQWLRSGMEMLLVGGGAAIVAYIIGFVLGN